MRRFVLFLFVCAVLLSFSHLAYADEDNIILNGDFEEGLGGEILFWQENVWESSDGQYEITLETEGAKTGDKCIKITSMVPKDVRLMQNVIVEPESLYKISGWIRTENVGNDQKGANLSIWLLMTTSEDIRGTSDWTYVEMYGRTGKDQNNLNFTIGLGGHNSLNSGIAYFDDIKIQKVPAASEGATVINLDTGQTSSGEDTQDGAPLGAGPIIGITTIILLVILLLFLIFKKPGSSDGAAKGKSESIKRLRDDPKEVKQFKIDKKDIVIMAVLTIVYSIIALINLGGTNVPKTFWQPARVGDSFIVEFDREYDLSKIAVYHGVGDLKLQVYYYSMEGEQTPGTTISQTYREVLGWGSFDLQVTTDRLRVIVDGASGGTINEMVFFETGNYETPIQGITIEEERAGGNGRGEIKNLFDEQDIGDYTNTYMTSSYFDEIYHPRTAFEHLNRMNPFETTHPPLGKVLMTLGIMIFGMNPFGWRLMGTLFGIAMIPVMYMFGKKVFKKRIYGFIPAFLITFEFMHFAQTRIGTIDSYPTLFVILAYYFMFDYFMNKSYEVGLRKSLTPLLLSGIFWGIGCATKWTAVYAGGGLALLYFISLLTEYKDYKRALTPKRKKRKPVWVDSFIKKHVIWTCLCCIIFFVVIPVLIYTASYLPIITLPGEQYNLGYVWENTKSMYEYHSTLTATHDFQSPAYTWPLIKKPLIEYRNTNLPKNKTSLMYVLGNPAVFWFGIACVFIAAIIAIKKKDKRFLPIIVAFAFQYLPWFRISRCIFIYHFFTSVPFLILCIVYVLYYVREHLPRDIDKMGGSESFILNVRKVSEALIFHYLLLNVLLFILFYPAISGMVVDSRYLNLVRWLGVR